MKSIARYLKSNSVTILTITVLYCISFVLIPINLGIFWDDWIIYKQEIEELVSFFKELGFFLYWPAYLHGTLLSSDIGIRIERLIIFFCFLFSGYFLFNVLTRVNELSRVDIFFIVSFFLLYPVNYARIAVCNLHYAICFFLFHLSVLLLSLYMSRKLLVFRILALVVLFFSYSTNSFLVYNYTLFLLILYFERRDITRFSDAVRVVLKYLDMLLLPIIFWIVKLRFFKPSGLYKSGYNSIRIQNLLKLPRNFMETLWYNYFGIYVRRESAELVAAVVCGLLFVFVSVFLFKGLRNKERDSWIKQIVSRRDLHFFLLSILIYIFSVLPYLIVGKKPNYEWGSRHQLLISLSCGFALYFGVRIGINMLVFVFESLKSYRAFLTFFIYSILLSSYVILNVSAYSSFHVDWNKQLSLVKEFRINKEIENNSTFLFVDNAHYLNATNRSYRFYEYTGLFELAFGDESRLGQNYEEYRNGTTVDERFFIKRYNLSDYEKSEPDYVVSIEPMRTADGTVSKFRLFLNNVFMIETLLTEANSLISLRLELW